MGCPVVPLRIGRVVRPLRLKSVSRLYCQRGRPEGRPILTEDKRMDESRKLGLFGATSVGVGAIVGGGILALAGVAFAETGPSAIVAFALNGVVAMLTALSIAEMACRFPQSGGTYTYSKKVLSVDAAFCVGWVAWFASVVAAVLYAVGFAHFALIAVREVTGAGPGHWLAGRWTETVVAMISAGGVALLLIRHSGGSGKRTNIAKLLVFAILIVSGLWAVVRQPAGDTQAALSPFFVDGLPGLFSAMGFTFIALQGFDLIAAVGGEVRRPARNLPLAMTGSLGIALAIYLPLLFVVATVGVDPGESVDQAARADREGIVALAARNFLGPFGYWMVIVAAILSMFSALLANLYAGSRICMAMARDRTLPLAFASANATGNPVYAVLLTAGLVLFILLLIPDVAVAGAASSLIFLVTFALAHWICILIRVRTGFRKELFRTPWFPAVPVSGGLACLALAIFQGVTVPSAGIIVTCWLVAGTMMFLFLFASPARVRHVTESALNPELLRLRGRSPLVLVPIANPGSAESLITLAGALVPPQTGRVVMLHVLVPGHGYSSADDPQMIGRSTGVIGSLLESARRNDLQAETLASFSDDPISEIARTARLHQCQSIVMGLSRLSDDDRFATLERQLASIDADVIVMRSSGDRALRKVSRIVVPVAGRGGHEYLLGRLLGSLRRSGPCPVCFVRVLPAGTERVVVRRERRRLRGLAISQLVADPEIQVLLHDEPVEAICQMVRPGDLIVLGATRVAGQRRIVGRFARQMAGQTDNPLVVISSRGG